MQDAVTPRACLRSQDLLADNVDNGEGKEKKTDVVSIGTRRQLGPSKSHLTQAPSSDGAVVSIASSELKPNEEMHVEWEKLPSTISSRRLVNEMQKRPLFTLHLL